MQVPSWKTCSRGSSAYTGALKFYRSRSSDGTIFKCTAAFSLHTVPL